MSSSSGESREECLISINSVIYLALDHQNKIEPLDVFDQNELAVSVKHLLQSERLALRIAVTLHELFREEWQHNYTLEVDNVFVHFLNMIINRSTSCMANYFDNLSMIYNIDKHLADIDTYIRKFGEDIQSKLKVEENKKTQLEMKRQIKEQQTDARKAVVMMFGDASKYKKMHLRQLNLLYQAHATCLKVLQHLVLRAEVLELSFYDFQVPTCWILKDSKMGPFEQFLKQKWGEKLTQLLGVDPEIFPWWSNEEYEQWEVRTVACRMLQRQVWEAVPPGKDQVTTFFDALSDVQRALWEVMTLAQPPLLDHQVMKKRIGEINTVRILKGVCDCGFCLEWLEPSLATWFLMWNKTFGLRLFDFLNQQHTKLIAAKSSENQKCSPRVRQLVEPRDQEHLISVMHNAATALRQAQQLDDAPQQYHIITDYQLFIFDPYVIMYLPWSSVLLQQWLSAALTCVLQFESASVELRHWGLQFDAARVVAVMLKMVSLAKQSLLLVLHLMCRQVVDFPNTDRQDLYPTTIMDEILKTLPVLEWLTSGYAGEMLQHLRSVALSTHKSITKYYVSKYDVHPTLQQNYSQHYWHVLFWLRGRHEMLPPVSDVPLDLDELLKEIESHEKMLPVSTMCLKPLKQEEQEIFNLCVMPTLPADIETRVCYLMGCARHVLATLHSSSVFTKKTYKAALGLLATSKAKAAATELRGYREDMSALGQILACSAIFCSLINALSGLDQNSSMLSSLVYLSGETLLREQLSRVATTCMYLTDVTSLPQVSSDIKQNKSSHVPFWHNHLPPHTKLRCNNVGIMLKHMQRQLDAVKEHSALFNTDLFWKCVKHPPVILTDELDENVALSHSMVENMLLHFCEDNLNKWRRGEEAFPFLLESCYWLTSHITLMVDYVESFLRDSKLEHDVSSDDEYDTVSTHTLSPSEDRVTASETVAQSKATKTTNGSQAQTAVAGKLPLHLCPQELQKCHLPTVPNLPQDHPTSVVRSCVKPPVPLPRKVTNTGNSAKQHCSNSGSHNSEDVNLSQNVKSVETATQASNSAAVSVCTCPHKPAVAKLVSQEAQCRGQPQAKVPIVNNSPPASSAAPQAPHADIKKENSLRRSVASTTCTENLEQNGAKNNKKMPVEAKENDCAITDKIEIVKEYLTESDKPEGEVKMTRKQRLRERRSKVLQNQVKQEKKNEVIDNDHRTELKLRLRERLQVPRTGQCTCHTRVHGECRESCESSEEEQREAKKHRPNKRKTRKDPKKTPSYQELETKRREEKEAKEVKKLKSVQKKKFIRGFIKRLITIKLDVPVDFIPKFKAMKCFHYMKVLIQSFIDEHSAWFHTPCPRQKGVVKQDYEAWGRHFDVMQAKCDAVATQFYLAGTRDLLRTHLGFYHKSTTLEEPLTGFTNFNLNMLSYVDGRKASYFEKSPELQRMLFEAGSKMLLPLAKAQYHQLFPTPSLLHPGKLAHRPLNSELSELQLASQALLVFKLVMDTQRSSQPSKVITMWKYLPSICESVQKNLLVGEMCSNEVISLRWDYSEQCRRVLTVFWRQAQEERRKLGKGALELCGQVRDLLSSRCPHFNLVVTMFQHAQLDLLTGVLALLPPDTTNYVSVKREAKSKDVPWCRCCLKLEPRWKKGSFSACHLCVEHDFPEAAHFCSFKCQDAVNSVHYMEHLHYLLSQVHLLST